MAMRRSDRTHRGLTLAELVLGMAVTSIIAAAGGGVAMVLSTAQTHQDDYRQSAQTASMVLRELRTLGHKAQLFPGAWGDRTAFWIDTNGSMTIQLSELTMIYHDSANHRLLETRLAFPAGWTSAQIAAVDTTLSVTSASSAATTLNTLLASPYAQTTVLAEDIWAFSVAGAAGGANNKWIETTVTAGTGVKAYTLRSTVALRAGLVGRV